MVSISDSWMICYFDSKAMNGDRDGALLSDLQA